MAGGRLRRDPCGRCRAEFGPGPKSTARARDGPSSAYRHAKGSRDQRPRDESATASFLTYQLKVLWRHGHPYSLAAIPVGASAIEQDRHKGGGDADAADGCRWGHTRNRQVRHHALVVV